MKTPPPPLHLQMQASFNTRCEQITNWFGGWTQCEQMVLVYDLLSRLNSSHNKFLLSGLSPNSHVDHQLSNRANDPAYISNLCCEPKNEAVMELLACLPLLEHKSHAAKREYLTILPKILAHSIDRSCDLEASRELLTYSLLHPVFTDEEKAQFNIWRQYLNPILPLNRDILSCKLAIANSLLYKQQPMQQHHQSINTPPYYINTNNSKDVHISNWLNNTDNNIMSPRSSVSSSSSNGERIRNSFNEEYSGMSEVAAWLKALRLHKYASLFQLMNYGDMMTLSESWLEMQGVTKGARHKIIINIDKLKKRTDILNSIESELLKPQQNIRAALNEVKDIVSTTPLPHSNTEYNELVKHVIRVMGKLLSQILIGPHYDEICLNQFQQLIDKCLQHKSFTFDEKRKFQIWQQQCSYCNSSNHFFTTQIPHQNNHYFEVKNPISRTHSAPIRTHPFTSTHIQTRPASDICVTEPEINASLDSLCLRMTEHALGTIN